MKKEFQILSMGKIEKWNKATDSTKRIKLSEQERQQILDSTTGREKEIYLTKDHIDITEGNTEALGFAESFSVDEEGNINATFNLNEEGQELIKKGIYKRTSIFARPDSEGALYLVSVSLTNAPADVEQEQIVFSATEIQKDLTKTEKSSIIILSCDINLTAEDNTNKSEEAGIEGTTEGNNQGEKTMTPEEIQALKDELAKAQEDLAKAMMKIEELSAQNQTLTAEDEAARKKKEEEAELEKTRISAIATAKAKAFGISEEEISSLKTLSEDDFNAKLEAMQSRAAAFTSFEDTQNKGFCDKNNTF